MAEFITGIQTADGVKQIDYNAVANKPDWEFIGEVIAETDLSDIGITLDSNGNAFELRKAYIEVEYVVSENITSSTQVGFSFDPMVYGYGGPFRCGGSPTSSNKGKRIILMVEVVNNRIALLSGYYSFNNDAAVGLLQSTASYDLPTAKTFDQSLGLDSITSVRHGSYQVVIGAGTTMKLWGIRK